VTAPVLSGNTGLKHLLDFAICLSAMPGSDSCVCLCASLREGESLYSQH
jgi:hypothetical protein